MTHTELKDNLVFASAQQMLQRLVEKGLITENEAESIRRDLRHRLRPTV
jgi:ribosomal protein S20